MNSTPADVDFESGINRRMEALLARKRTENEAAIARITALDTAWEKSNSSIDKELKGGLATARVEQQAMQDAQGRLERNVCDGVNKNEVGIAGKVVDIKSKVGLPGLAVKLDVALDGAPQNPEVRTDNYGDFFFSFAVDPAVLARLKELSILITVSFEDTVVFREQRVIAATAGNVEHLTIEVDCSGKLADVLEHGRQVAAGVAGDAKLVAMRVANFDVAYSTFNGLASATLAHLRTLKQELSGVASPAGTTSSASFSAASASTRDTSATTDAAVKPTRYLGNSHDRELHDTKNTKKQCNLEAIKPDYRVYFRTEREAVAAGYDFCKYCFGKQKSKR